MELCLRDPSQPGAYVASMADFTHLYTDRWGWRAGWWAGSKTGSTSRALLRLEHHDLPHRSLSCTFAPTVPPLYCRPQDLQYACVTILNMNPDSPSRQTLYHTLLDLYLSPGSASSSGCSGSGDAAGAAAPSSSSSSRGGGEAAAGAAAEGTSAGPSGSSSGATRQGPAAAQASSSSNSSHREALDLLKWVQHRPRLPWIGLPALACFLCSACRAMPACCLGICQPTHPATHLLKPLVWRHRCCLPCPSLLCLPASAGGGGLQGRSLPMTSIMPWWPAARMPSALGCCSCTRCAWLGGRGVDGTGGRAAVWVAGWLGLS